MGEILDGKAFANELGQNYGQIEQQLGLKQVNE